MISLESFSTLDETFQDRVDKMDSLDHVAHSDPLVHPAPLVGPVNVVRREALDRLETLASEDALVNLVLRVKQDPMENLVNAEARGNLVQLVTEDVMDPTGLLVLSGLKASAGYLANVANLEHLDLLVLPVKQACPDPQVINLPCVFRNIYYINEKSNALRRQILL